MLYETQDRCRSRRVPGMCQNRMSAPVAQFAQRLTGQRAGPRNRPTDYLSHVD